MTKTAIEVVADNVDRLIAEPGFSVAELERLTQGRISHSTLERVRRGRGSVGIAILSEIAHTFDFELWQLCVDGFDPSHPPTLSDRPVDQGEKLSDSERLLLTRFRQLDPSTRRVILEVVTLFTSSRSTPARKK